VLRSAPWMALLRSGEIRDLKTNFNRWKLKGGLDNNTRAQNQERRANIQGIFKLLSFWFDHQVISRHSIAFKDNSSTARSPKFPRSDFNWSFRRETHYALGDSSWPPDTLLLGDNEQVDMFTEAADVAALAALTLRSHCPTPNFPSRNNSSEHFSPSANKKHDEKFQTRVFKTVSNRRDWRLV
jgi:hypothetical protein